MKTTSNPRNAGRPQNGNYKISIDAQLQSTAPKYRGPFCLYGLVSSEEPETIQYVGFTSMLLNQRYNEHMSTAARKVHTKRAQWINSVLHRGYHVILVLLEDGISTRKEACTREQCMILHYRDAGHELTNMTKGGLGILGLRHTSETRTRQSEANSGDRHYKRRRRCVV